MSKDISRIIVIKVIWIVLILIEVLSSQILISY
jgi:hypothetical protein